MLNRIPLSLTAPRNTSSFRYVWDMECSEVVRWKNFDQIGRFDKDNIKDQELKDNEDVEVIMDFEWVIGQMAKSAVNLLVLIFLNGIFTGKTLLNLTASL